MAKIGGMELVVILIVALFAIGPERMPKVARTLGRAMGSFNKSLKEATKELREVSDEFKGVTDEIASAQKTMKEAFMDVGDEVKKTEREVNAMITDTKLVEEKKAEPAAVENAENAGNASEAQDLIDNLDEIVANGEEKKTEAAEETAQAAAEDAAEETA